MRLVETLSGRVRLNQDDRSMNEYWWLMLAEYERELKISEKHDMA